MPRKARDQFDLFTRPQTAKGCKTPQWLELPMETRAALTKMMARLILDHAGTDKAAPAHEQRIARDA